MNYDLLIDLHKYNQRQGPGGNIETQLALQLTNLKDSVQHLQIADIGCGTGASTMILAEQLTNASITAIDLFPEFLDILNQNIIAHKMNEKIKTMATSMETLSFDKNSLDMIWSEGAIYNIGFSQGIAYFKSFLKPNGILAVSEITWLTNERPEEIEKYWHQAYPEIATASDKIKILENNGFVLKGYFPLPESCWIDNYYTPLENNYSRFLNKHHSKEAQAIIENEKIEIALYKKYRHYVSYGFYIAQKR